MVAFSPNLFVENIQDTLEFYKILGFRSVMTVPGEKDGEIVWALASTGNISFMFQTLESLGDDFPWVSRQPGGSLLFYFRVRNIRSFFKSLEGRVTIVKGLEKTFYGATEFSILDNNNFVLTFGEDEEEETTEDVDENSFF